MSGYDRIKDPQEDKTPLFTDAAEGTIGRKNKITAFALISITIVFIILIIILNLFVLNTNHPNGVITSNLPIVVNTWDFKGANQRGWEALINGSSTVDAIEKGCNHCENYPEECNYSVGYGGSPNEVGETTLDAMIMYGPTHDAGAVACLKRVKNAISVARKVMEETLHTLLVGEDATTFALYMNFTLQDLTTNRSTAVWYNWSRTHSPNYWKNGPPSGWYNTTHNNINVNPTDSHDTIGMIAVDKDGNICVGTSTNGLRYKIPGRVGDTPIPGAGAYVDNDIGGAVATGDGDVLLRFLPSFRAVENMRQGMSPLEAARKAVSMIPKFYNTSRGAVVAVNKRGEFGAASFGTYMVFPFWVRRGGDMEEGELRNVSPITE